MLMVMGICINIEPDLYIMSLSELPRIALMF